MTISVDAVYEKGVLKLEGPVDLQDKTRVRVTIEAPETEPADDDDPTGWKTARELIGCIEDGPEDGAENHDRYIYGYHQEK